MIRSVVLIFLFLVSGFCSAQEEGLVIVLYGTQCAGKSTLVDEFRKITPREFLVVKRTPTLVKLRMDFVEKHTGVRPKSRKELTQMERKLPPHIRKHGGGKFKRPALIPTIQEIRTLLDQGKLVIFDVCLYDKKDFDLMRDLNARFVYVYTPIPDLSIREQDRTQGQNRSCRGQMEC